MTYDERQIDRGCAVIQNGYAIFGEGHTIAEAVADANDNLEDEVFFEEWGSDTLLDFTGGRFPTAMMGDLYITDDQDDIQAHREGVTAEADGSQKDWG